MDKKIFASRFKETMNKKGISAAELSRRTGVSEGVISQYRSGKYEPKRDRLEMFARILEVSPAWLGGYAGLQDYNKEFDTAAQYFSTELTAKRLQILRKNCGLSIDELANRLGVHRNIIIRRENGDGIGAITVPEMYSMVDIFQTNYLYISGFLDDPSLNADSIHHTCETYNQPTVDLFAVITKVSIGPNKFKYEGFDGFRSEVVESVYEYFFFKMPDDSMEPFIRKGDVAFVHKQDKVLSGELTLIAFRDNPATIRKVLESTSRGIMLMPIDMMNYDLTYFPNDTEDCSIVGKIIYTESRYNLLSIEKPPTAQHTRRQH